MRDLALYWSPSCGSVQKERVARLFGHPVHAVLTDFPLALLVVATVADLYSAVSGDAALATVGYYCVLLGLLSAGLAAVFGFWDLLRIEPSGHVLHSALRHAAFALGAVSLYVLAFALRSGSEPERVSTPVLALELAGAALLGAAGWFGGHLVFGHGVGVHSTGDD